ncbi:hypothetical protein MMA231_02548 [Asticcacaulis sp. MM231]|uniref:DUF736 domain-containing protein n=1 Tax=Asticcacaulis sp. MM231 TaxID=3157666 RepID=UPI0032D575F1
MAIIGTFTASGQNFTGKINTLKLDVDIHIVATEAPSENSPDFRLMAGDVEVGAGWKRTGRDSRREYLSVKLDDPTFPHPVYASLVASDAPDVFHLIWSRPSGS